MNKPVGFLPSSGVGFLIWMHTCLLFAFIAAPAFSQPSIFWTSDPVQSGEAVIVIGDGFGANPKVELKKLDDAPGLVRDPID
jgi:hypothetical protein